MPRHTHPRIRAKHDRGAVRHARQRVIARRFDAHKNQAAGSYAHFDLHPDLVDDDLTDDVVELLRQAKQHIPASPLGCYDWPQPELARVIDAALSRRLGNDLIPGRLAKGPLPVYCDGCMFCRPYRHYPGWRGRVKHHHRYLIDDGLAAWRENDDSGDLGRLASANRELRPLRGYC